MKKWQQREVEVARGWCVSRPPCSPRAGKEASQGKVSLVPHRFPTLQAGSQDTPDSGHPDRGQAPSLRGCKSPSLPFLALRRPCPGVRWKPGCPVPGRGGAGTRRGRRAWGQEALHLCALSYGCLRMSSRVCISVCSHACALVICDRVHVCS